MTAILYLNSSRSDHFDLLNIKPTQMVLIRSAVDAMALAYENRIKALTDKPRHANADHALFGETTSILKDSYNELKFLQAIFLNRKVHLKTSHDKLPDSGKSRNSNIVLEDYSKSCSSIQRKLPKQA